MITEFQAVNDSTFADVDGEFSDWIEIHNPDVTAISLDNWYLTDDKTNLRKWQFPAGTTIGPGEYRLVVASGKDRSRPEEELHTNFRLSGDGEYLGLIKPDGITPVQVFDPFPEQDADVSFGLAPGRSATELVVQGDPVKALVPEDDTLESRWFELEHDDSQWITGTTAVGYEVLNAGRVVRNDFDALGPEWTIDNPGAATVSVEDGALTMNVPTGQVTNSDDRGRAPIVFRDAPTFPDGSPAQSWEIVTQITQQADDMGRAGIVVLDGATGAPVIKLQYDPSSSTGRFEMRVLDSRVDSIRVGNDSYFLRLARNNVAKTWTAYFKSEEADDWTQIARTEDGQDDMPVIADPKPALYAETEVNDTTNARFDFVEVTIDDEMPIYGPSTGLDVLNSLKDRNGSIYMRIPFSVDADPAQFDELSMLVRFDDGYRAYLNGVLVSEENAPLPPPPPNPDILSWDARAQGTHGANFGPIPVNQIDLSDHLGLLRQGDNVLAVQGLNVSRDDEDFFFDARLIASNLVSEKAQFFVQPSPGQANLVPAPRAPTIVANEGIFFGSTTVELELTEPLRNLEIRYTLDGSEPTSESLLYKGQITLTSSAMLQARTFDKSENPTLDPSPVSAATFVAADEQLRNRTSDIPIIILDTLEQPLIPASSNSLTSVSVLAVEVSKATGRAALENGVVDYLGRGGIRDRGSSTAGQPKPNLAFETWGPEGSDRDDDANVPLLGFSAESDWVLHAPHHFDRAMIRNQLAFDLSNQMGQWAPETRAVEVYLNRTNGTVGEDDYMGVYVLMEKIKQGEDRVDIAEIDRDDNREPEVGGGYIWKIDRPDPDAGTFSGGGITVNWVYPKSPSSRTASDDQKATNEQQDWVIQHFNQLRDALGRDITDPNGYSQLVDIPSWVDHHLINVFMQNGDAVTLSTFLHKDRNGKIAMGPIWDFDRSAESLDDRDNTPELWGRSGTRDFFSRGWYTPVFRDAGFWQAYVDRWTELRRTTMSLSNLDATIDKLADEIRESQERNYLAPVNRNVRPRSGSAFASGKLDGTWQGEVEHLRKWLHDRLKFMDSNFVQPPLFVQNGESIEKVAPDTLVERTGVSVTTGEPIEIRGPLHFRPIDTAVVSGEPGVTMARYFSPADNSLGTDWAQPDFDDSMWMSGPTGLGFETSPKDFTELLATQARPATDGTTILMRIPFEVTDVDAAKAQRLVLKMKYDDGFVAYLNGEEVVRNRIRDDDLRWNSRASTHSNSEAVLFEEFDVSDFGNLLVEGTNLLAIRAINSSATSDDMLMLPELATREIRSLTANIYYTTDGSDPRGPDGNPAPTAQRLARGESISIDQNTRIITRNFDDVIDRGPQARVVRTDWSAPIEYDFIVATPQLVVSEINYNPAEPTPQELEEGFDSRSFEFIEIKNVGDTTADLVGIEIADAVEFDFFGSQIQMLQPGGYLLVVADEQALEQRYGEGLPIAGEYTGRLSNNGEQIELVNGLDAVIFTVNYNDNDPWPVRADGAGATLELVDPNNTLADLQNKWYSWRASRENGGSPGRAGDGSPRVAINEILARPQGPNQFDAIELMNVSDESIDISGWYLSDSIDDLFEFSIPAGTVLTPGQLVVFDRNVLPFGLDGSEGDDVWLVRKGDDDRVAFFEDDVHFGPTAAAETLGRVPNGTGRLAPLVSQSLNAVNSAPRVGPVIISEIHYNPVLDDPTRIAFPTITDSDLEFIEIHNPTDATVDLSNSRIRGGPGFRFDEGTVLSPSGTVVVLKFNPEDPQNINELNAFRSQFSVGEDVTLVGGYSGRLNNSYDRIELQSPDVQDAAPELIFHVQADEVLYDDYAPWPIGADGTGLSLQRTSVSAFGNDGGSFVAAAPTPGRTLVGLPGDFDRNGVVDTTDINLLFEQIRSDNPDLGFDLNRDGSVNTVDRDFMVESILATDMGDSNLDGIFDSRDLAFVFQAKHYEDGIPLNSKWEHGDWNADGDFTSSDLVLAFQNGGYVGAALNRPMADEGHIAAALTSSSIDVGTGDVVEARTETAREADRISSRPSLLLLDSAMASLFADEIGKPLDQDEPSGHSDVDNFWAEIQLKVQNSRFH